MIFKFLVIGLLVIVTLELAEIISYLEEVE